MKPSTQGTAILKNSAGEDYAISLGRSSEHEVETPGLDILFSIGSPHARPGLARRMQRAVDPDRLVFLDGLAIERHDEAGDATNTVECSALAIAHPKLLQTALDFTERGNTSFFGLTASSKDADGLSASWDGSRGLALVAATDRSRRLLRLLADAFLAQDTALLPSDSPAPLGGAGPIMAIASRVGPEIRAALQSRDERIDALRQADRKAAIRDRLLVSGRRFLALTPRHLPSEADGAIATSHDLLYWLNPLEQETARSGLYTVEELEAWCEGRGPVLKQTATPSLYETWLEEASEQLAHLNTWR